MSDTSSSILQKLKELSSIDSLILRYTLEQKKLSEELQKRSTVLKSLETKCATIKKVIDEKKLKYSKEEKFLANERDKLNERRQALVTLNNYKVQQAAEREIDHAAKQLQAQEEVAINLLGEIETLQNDFNQTATTTDSHKNELKIFEQEVSSVSTDLTQRIDEQNNLRTNLLSTINDPQSLTIYSRAREKFPSDPVTHLVNNDSCAGCYIKVGPQVIVQLSKGMIVKCPGCNRILSLLNR